MTVLSDYAAAVLESLQFFTTYNLSCKASPWIIYVNLVTKWPSSAIRDIFIKSQRGAFEILDLFWTNFGPVEKLWTFQYAARFRGPGILIRRSTIVDLAVCHVAHRYLTKHPKKV